MSVELFIIYVTESVNEAEQNWIESNRATFAMFIIIHFLLF